MVTEVKKLRSATEVAKRAEIRRAIAARLMKARIEAGFATASDTARELGIATPTYLAHENGTRSVRPDAIKWYANTFGVRAEWFLTGEGEMRSSDSPAVPELKDTLLHLTNYCLQLAGKLDEEQVEQLFTHVAALFQFLKKVV
jgi:hypothetical protein